jgi:hypothetical protein
LTKQEIINEIALLRVEEGKLQGTLSTLTKQLEDMADFREGDVIRDKKGIVYKLHRIHVDEKTGKIDGNGRAYRQRKDGTFMAKPQFVSPYWDGPWEVINRNGE